MVPRSPPAGAARRTTSPPHRPHDLAVIMELVGRHAVECATNFMITGGGGAGVGEPGVRESGVRELGVREPGRVRRRGFSGTGPVGRRLSPPRRPGRSRRGRHRPPPASVPAAEPPAPTTGCPPPDATAAGRCAARRTAPTRLVTRSVKYVASRLTPIEPPSRWPTLNSVFASASWSGRWSASTAVSSGWMTRPMPSPRPVIRAAMIHKGV